MHRVAIIQRDIAWSSIAENLDAVESIILGVDADVVVLSEMFQTGFVTSPEGFADDGATLRRMQKWADAIDAAIVGSVIIRERDGFRNRMYFVKPAGEVEYYDKRHLFSVGGEAEHFVRGDERKVVEWRGVRYLLEICYDLRFPVWSRQRGDYDAIIYSALWPSSRREVWRTLLRARAIENQAYVVGVNRIGAEPTLNYVGDSAIIDFYGRAVVDMADREDMAVAELDMTRLAEFREKFAAWRDADEYILT